MSVGRDEVRPGLAGTAGERTAEVDVAPGHAAGEPMPVRECAAFPLLVRWLAIGITVTTAVLAALAFDELRRADWRTASLALWAGAWIAFAWIGYWIVHSRTRLEEDTLVQSWLWDKRVSARDVAQLKLVHWAWLDRLMAPRLLVRQRTGVVVWIHAEDAKLLRDFAERVAGRAVPQAPRPAAPDA